MPENTEFVIKDRIVSLSDYAFFGCSNLLSITILKSVTSIGMYEFAKCSNLTKIIYKGTKAELGALKKDYGWDLESSLKEIYCTDGKINFFFTSRITLSTLKLYFPLPWPVTGKMISKANSFAINFEAPLTDNSNIFTTSLRPK